MEQSKSGRKKDNGAMPMATLETTLTTSLSRRESMERVSNLQTDKKISKGTESPGRKRDTTSGTLCTTEPSGLIQLDVWPDQKSVKSTRQL